MAEIDAGKPAYQVLARKYRPQTFADLYGQEAMVRTLRNAFAADRIAHAFVLTGVRGVGKTTTARIVAKGLNCIGADGKGGPTIEPCGVCEPCLTIAAGRNVDVMEMDAASRTGVNDIREIIDSVNYRAASARYKIYIIDEVHMLSTQAFNALLKTLEEPPEHVKFIFATTEIRKIPVTVLSRCQRFDLRRIEPDVMMAFLRGIAGKEGAVLPDDALALITRASEGSARDALSLMDQAIAHGAGETTVVQVRAMLGLADRGRVLDLFDLVMKGDVQAALAELAAQYAEGGDPVAILRDLAEVTHWISVVKIAPDAADDPTVTPDERERGSAMAAGLPMRALTRMWQMLLKALEEVAVAPNAMMAAEMAIIRLTHVADLPGPEDLVRRLQDAPPAAGAGPAAGVPGRDGGPGPRAMVIQGGAVAVAPQPAADALARFARFDDVVALIRANRNAKLLMDVESGVRLVLYAPGRIEFEPSADAPADLAQRLGSRLQEWTGQRWTVSVVSTGGGQTLREIADLRRTDLQGLALQHPMVQAVMAAFPGSVITEVRVAPDAVEAQAVIEAGEAGDDWSPIDPFDGD